MNGEEKNFSLARIGSVGSGLVQFAAEKKEAGEDENEDEVDVVLVADSWLNLV